MSSPQGSEFAKRKVVEDVLSARGKEKCGAHDLELIDVSSEVCIGSIKLFENPGSVANKMLGSHAVKAILNCSALKISYPTNIPLFALPDSMGSQLFCSQNISVASDALKSAISRGGRLAIIGTCPETKAAAFAALFLMTHSNHQLLKSLQIVSSKVGDILKLESLREELLQMAHDRFESVFDWPETHIELTPEESFLAFRPPSFDLSECEETEDYSASLWPDQ